jgi:hypothetical protein
VNCAAPAGHSRYRLCATSTPSTPSRGCWPLCAVRSANMVASRRVVRSTNSSMSARRNFAGPARTSRSTHSPPGAVPHSTQEMCESYTFVELSKERRPNVGPPLGADSLTGIAQPRSRLMASGRRPPASTRPRGR